MGAKGRVNKNRGGGVRRRRGRGTDFKADPKGHENSTPSASQPAMGISSSEHPFLKSWRVHFDEDVSTLLLCLLKFMRPPESIYLLMFPSPTMPSSDETVQPVPRTCSHKTVHPAIRAHLPLVASAVTGTRAPVLPSLFPLGRHLFSSSRRRQGCR